MPVETIADFIRIRISTDFVRAVIGPKKIFQHKTKRREQQQRQKRRRRRRRRRRERCVPVVKNRWEFCNIHVRVAKHSAWNAVTPLNISVRSITKRWDESCWRKWIRKWLPIVFTTDNDHPGRACRRNNNRDDSNSIDDFIMALRWRDFNGLSFFLVSFDVFFLFRWMSSETAQVPIRQETELLKQKSIYLNIQIRRRSNEKETRDVSLVIQRRPLCHMTSKREESNHSFSFSLLSFAHISAPPSDIGLSVRSNLFFVSSSAASVSLFVCLWA